MFLLPHPAHGENGHFTLTVQGKSPRERESKVHNGLFGNIQLEEKMFPLCFPF